MSSLEPRVAADLIENLRARVRGRVIDPAANDYDEARRGFYSGFDRRPLAIVRVVDAADVAAVLGIVRDAGVPLAVRSGGHSPAGHSTADGGVVLDLAAMKRLDVDVSSRSAWADAGLTAGEYTDAAGAHGLVTGFGDAGSVGISGITLCGGVGFLHRRFGMTIDNVLAAEVVTASGEILHVDAGQHEDLFWAIRGGGGNFGVVTRWHYRLHEIGTVLAGIVVLPATPDIIPAVLDAVMEAPEALSGVIAVMPAPPMPFFPPEVHGRMIVMVNLVHSGTEEEADRDVARLRSIATPLMEMLQRVPYPAVYHHGEPPKPPLMAMRPTFADTIGRDEAERIIDGLRTSRARMSVTHFRVLGGAVARVPNDATAFAHRDRGTMAIVAAAVMDPAEWHEHQAWADALAAGLQQGTPGAYTGFMGADDTSRVREAYGDAAWRKLTRIKAKYDPANLFRLNQNIPPG